MNVNDEALRVLIVEDSEYDATLLIEALKDGGFIPDFLRVDGEAPLRAAIQNGEWDIAFCDDAVPTFNAVNAIRVLRAEVRDLPIIVVSGAIGEDLAVETLRMGANDYVSKGDLRRLASAVRRELREADARREGKLVEAKKRHAEDALRASGERYRILFEHNPIPMWVYDRTTWRFLQVNQAAVTQYGYSREEFLQLSVLDLRSPEDVAKLLEEVGGQGNDAPLSRGKRRHRKKDGTVVFVEVVSQPIQYGAQQARIAQALDVTEYTFAERELIRIKTAVESASDAIAVIDEAGTSVYHNRAFVELLGYEPSQLNAAGGPRCLFVHQQIAEEVCRALSQTSSWAGNAYLNRRAKGPVRLFVRVNVARDEDGRMTTKTIVCTDLREQQRAEGKIEEQAALLDHAQDAIIVHDLNGRVTYWNNSSRRVFGWTVDEALGKRVRELLHDDGEPFDDAMAELLRNGAWTGELTQRNKDGSEVLVEGRWTLVRDDFGDPKSVLSINTDITEKKMLEAQFLRSQRMESIGTLAGGIAHDLNNVLGPIIMAVDLFKLKMTDPKDLELLETVAVSAQRGVDMVKQVLSFARGIEGQRALIRPALLLRELAKIVRDTFPKSITILVSAPEDTWNLLGDHTQLHQVLLNLCVNARDAMPVGGILQLTTNNTAIDPQFAAMHPDARPGSYVVLEVTDNGVGMEPEMIEKIFEPFFTTKALGMGTGLGLSTTLAITRSHGGFITVKSAIGQGTKFRVHLPANLNSSQIYFSETGDEYPRGHGECVLIIDDEASVRSITSQTLEAFGYRVITAADGAEGLAKYTQFSGEISAVVSDLMMPVMDGVATIRALKRLSPNVRIIVASGLTGKAAEAEAANEGIKNFLPKPYTASALLIALRGLLDPSHERSPD